MKVVFLGTGGTYPSKTRNVASVAVQVGPDVVMFDCGEGTQRQLMYSDVSFMRIRAIFVSHLHADHFLGITGLVQSMSLNGREDPLKVIGPLGTRETVKNMLSLGYFDCGFEVVCEDIGPGDVVDFATFKVEAGEASHTVPTLAYRLEENPRPGRFDTRKAADLGIPEGPLFGELQEGKTIVVNGTEIRPSQVVGGKRRGRSLVYSGDTRPCESVVALARDVDALVHDCTLCSDHSATASEFGHSTALEAAQTADASGALRLYLVHFSPRYDDPAQLEDEARKVFPRAYAARDFDSIQIPHRDGVERRDVED